MIFHSYFNSEQSSYILKTKFYTKNLKNITISEQGTSSFGIKTIFPSHHHVSRFLFLIQPFPQLQLRVWTSSLGRRNPQRSRRKVARLHSPHCGGQTRSTHNRTGLRPPQGAREHPPSVPQKVPDRGVHPCRGTQEVARRTRIPRVLLHGRPPLAGEDPQGNR